MGDELATVRHNVRVALAARGWTQSDLAQRMGWTQSVLGAYLGGRRDITPHLARMCDALDLTLSALVEGSPCPACGSDTAPDEEGGT